jgi:hypothetical protein
VNEWTYNLASESLVPALLAFAATYFSKKGALRFPVTAERRVLCAVVIYTVCLAVNLVVTALVFATGPRNRPAYEITFLLVPGLVAYFAGMRVIRSKP